jgi:hypothetical protein
MKPITYRLVERCVEDGISQGIEHFNKHCDIPYIIPEDMKQSMHDYVMLNFSEWFTFTNEELGVSDS